MTSESPSRNQSLWLVALIAFAVLVRLIGVDWDDKHFFHPDERAIASAIGRLSFSPLQLNPDFFAYGSFPFYVIRAVSDVLVLIARSASEILEQIEHLSASYPVFFYSGAGLLALLFVSTPLLRYRRGHGFYEQARNIGVRLLDWRLVLLIGFLVAAFTQISNFGSYVAVIHTGRAVLGVVGVLTVFLLYRLATELYGEKVGLTAGFLLAACPLHVQNSHYSTTDIFLTFLVLLTLYNLVGVVRDGRLRHYIYAGLALGLAVATKFSALPLLAPLGIAVLVRLYEERRAFPIAAAVLAVLTAALAFAAGQPYALLDFARFSHDIEEQSRMVRNAGLFPYTNQYVGTPKYFYELKQMILWGMAPALGIAAVLAAGARIWGTIRERSPVDLMLLAYVLPFFLVTGWFDVKFPRYLLPIYPVLILWAAAMLDRAARRSVLAVPILWTVIVTTGLATLALLSVYLRPHTVVTASEWFYAHIPAGSTVLTQHWDEGFPFSLPGKNRNTQRYEIIELAYYEPDSSTKMRKIAQDLEKADYIAFQTKRLYGALTQAAKKFPLSNNYFYLLFGGDLGYELIYEASSRPRLFGFEFYDELADESLTVYDHPKVLIFQNTGKLGADEIFDKILQGMPSRKLTRDDILLAGTGVDAPAASAVSAPIRSSVEALLWFVALVQVVGLCAYTILRRWLPVQGCYALAKVLGILFLAYPPWIATGLGVGFTRDTLTTALVILIAVALFAARGAVWRTGRAEIAATEVLFWGTFSLFLFVRAFNPEVFWGEKPMDFAFLNALTRTTELPPPEPWFSGSLLHYTYFGHYIVAALGKLCDIHPAITFNLGIALFGALTAAAAFAAGCAISRRWPVGLLSAFFVILIGNLSGVREAIARRVFNFDYFWATSRVLKDTINEYPLWSFLFADLHAHVLVMPFSLTFLTLALLFVQRREEGTPLRAIPLFLLIAFSLGAIMVTSGWSAPTYILLFPFLLAVTQLGRFGIGRARLLTAVLIGAIVVLPALTLHYTNPQPVSDLLRSWGLQARDVYSQVAFAGVGLAVFAVIPAISLATVTLVGLAYALYLPFWSYFSPPPRNWGFEDQSFANFYDFGNIFGVYLFVAVPFFFVLWRNRLAPRGGRIGALRTTAMWIFGLTVLGCFVLSVPAVADRIPAAIPLRGSLRIGLAALAALGLHVSLQRSLDWPARLAAILLTFAFAVTAGTDIVYVWDRMNTIFKFYLESWFLFAIGSAVALGELWRGGIRSRSLRGAWQSSLFILIGVGLFTGGTAIYGAFNTKRVPTIRPTLDGTAYLEKRNAHELYAFEWINANVRGIPVIAEAHGPSYQEFTRVSMNTGLPTVLGWDYHVHQRAHRWPDIRKRKADLKTLYTSDQKQTVREILRHYNVALVYVGGLERRTHQGANLKNFNEWTDLLTPVYQNRDVTVFAVNGQFTGAMPITTIEEVPQVAEEDEVHLQAADGNLRQPRGLAIDSAGQIYVADFGNDRIQVFDQSTKFLRTWGDNGSLPGQFKQASSISIAPNGDIHVADTWNQRVQVFSPEGEYLREWGGGFYGPRGITVGPQGFVYLADSGNHKIRRFTPEGVEDLTWGKLGDAEGDFSEPVGITTDAEGNVYVADNGNARLQIFDADGVFLDSFPVKGWQLKVYSEPNVAVTPEGVIWVTVPAEQAVRAYDRNGKQLEEHVGREPGEGFFHRAMGIVVDPKSGEIIVTDLEGAIVRLPRKAAQ